MQLADAIELFSRLTPLNIPHTQMQYIFGMSKMTIVNENEKVKQKYHRLRFVEFLEVIGRSAHHKFKGTGMSDLTLTKKIEYVLDDLLTYIGATRKDVDIGLDEQSASDDEY